MFEDEKEFKLDDWSSYLVQEARFQASKKSHNHLSAQVQESSYTNRSPLSRQSIGNASNPGASNETFDAWENIPLIVRQSFATVSEECQRLRDEVSELKRGRGKASQHNSIQNLVEAVNRLEQLVQTKPSMQFVQDCINTKANKSDIYAMIPPQDIDKTSLDARFKAIEGQMNIFKASLLPIGDLQDKIRSLETVEADFETFKAAVVQQKTLGVKHGAELESIKQCVQQFEKQESNFLESLTYFSAAMKQLNTKVSNMSRGAGGLVKEADVLDIVRNFFLRDTSVNDWKSQCGEHSQRVAQEAVNQLKEDVLTSTRSTLETDISNKVEGMLRGNQLIEQLQADQKQQTKRLKEMQKAAADIDTLFKEHTSRFHALHATTESIKETLSEHATKASGVQSHLETTRKLANSTAQHLKTKLPVIEELVVFKQESNIAKLALQLEDFASLFTKRQTKINKTFEDFQQKMKLYATKEDLIISSAEKQTVDELSEKMAKNEKSMKQMTQMLAGLEEKLADKMSAQMNAVQMQIEELALKIGHAKNQNSAYKKIENAACSMEEIRIETRTQHIDEDTPACSTTPPPPPPKLISHEEKEFRSKRQKNERAKPTSKVAFSHRVPGAKIHSNGEKSTSRRARKPSRRATVHVVEQESDDTSAILESLKQQKLFLEERLQNIPLLPRR